MSPVTVRRKRLAALGVTALAVALVGGAAFSSPLAPPHSTAPGLKVPNKLLAPPARGQRVALRATSYWEGEWICADCGYIYNERVFGQKFEDLQAGFKCPSCAAPRRRFARKLGDKIGTTLDGGDTPILVFSALALVVVLAIAYFALQ
eukprot:CAMPEP_0171095332 /NCGR_PEP_ID=MMETSP0766_2-20121228/43114_1 /TAXON_ID=439317 /ORGANISM="Gambierdiscus australes, Strain CAWD 149" /LENGTH=147 /DNA_ID=CAMNT_0011554125 /DNA_START=48 /DNA_END=491 /DNA_ORIENTATION=+